MTDVCASSRFLAAPYGSEISLKVHNVLEVALDKLWELVLAFA